MKVRAKISTDALNVVGERDREKEREERIQGWYQ